MFANAHLSPDRLSRSKGRPFVLCVDDDRRVLAALRRALRTEPFHFGFTTDPEEALDCVRSRFVDLILVDYRMEGLSGTGLLQMVKAASPATLRVMLTGDPEDTWIRSAQEKGLMSVCGKPWKDSDLRDLIRGRLDSRRDEPGANPDLPASLLSKVNHEC